MTLAETLILASYFFVLVILAVYGWHRYFMVYLYMRHKHEVPVPQAEYDHASLPVVTIQLPLYNEMYVVDRLVDSVCAIDYPREKLEIQILDDSTDETRTIAEAAARRHAAEGIDIKYIHRTDRSGYKAGALEAGMHVARGTFIAIFDADFVPQSSFLRDLIHHFAEAEVGMVQTRWGHMNRDANLLTKVQALMLDGHHLVENTARFGSGCFFNFAGTGGMWRKTAIEAAGGWEHDTLTEDLDLSYRAQMAGYRFVYRPDILTPSELPEDMSALRAQQHRWAKGTVQTARKLLPTVVRADVGWHQRIEACFHMLPHFAYPLMLLLSILLLPALLLLPAADFRTMMLIDLPLCFGATGSLAAFYIVAERSQGRSAWGAVRRLPILIALGTGLSPHLSGAVVSGMRQMAGEFVRTPKRGESAGRYRQGAKLPWAEMALTLLCSSAVVAALSTGHWFAAPFALLFAWGYGYVATSVIQEQLPALRRIPAVSPDLELEEAPLAKAA